MLKYFSAFALLSLSSLTAHAQDAAPATSAIPVGTQFQVVTPIPFSGYEAYLSFTGGAPGDGPADAISCSIYNHTKACFFREGEPCGIAGATGLLGITATYDGVEYTHTGSYYNSETEAETPVNITRFDTNTTLSPMFGAIYCDYPIGHVLTLEDIRTAFGAYVQITPPAVPAVAAPVDAEAAAEIN